MIAPDLWVDDPAPGGFVCSVCLMPVESEPCTEHQDPYDEPVWVQGHSHAEPICAWPDCQTYLTREQMQTIRDDGGES